MVLAPSHWDLGAALLSPHSKERVLVSVGRWVQSSVGGSACMLLLPPPLPRPIPVLPCLLGAPSPSFCLQHHFPFSWAFCERPGNWSPDSLGTRFPGWVSAWSPPLVLSPQLLEYLGKGKSIVDVGLAQARRPLSTRSHYFEVEIVDPGEKCYIALGLARKVGTNAGFLPG